MRITLVIAGLGGGGAERVCVNLANAWVARNHKPTILTISQNSRPSSYPIDARVERRDIGWRRSARSYELNPVAIAPILRGFQALRCPELIQEITLLALLRYAILATKPDVVVSKIDETNVRVLAAMHETNVPVVVCEVTDARRVVMKRYARAREVLYRRAAAVVAPDPAIADWFTTRGARADRTRCCRRLVAQSLPPAPVAAHDARRHGCPVCHRVLSARERPAALPLRPDTRPRRARCRRAVERP
jgi:UDP-N-acetylglucosamine:LPS N-acetylglucosamine transferase